MRVFADLQALTKMADVIVTIQIMPESPDTDLNSIKRTAENKIREFAKLNEEQAIKVEEEPLAFGLQVLKFYFYMNESIGGTEPLEEKLKKIAGVASAETTDVRRAIG